MLLYFITQSWGYDRPTSISSSSTSTFNVYLPGQKRPLWLSPLSRHSLFLALRPVLLSTELSSFSRLAGIMASPPKEGFLPVCLYPLWGPTGKGPSCWCLTGEWDEGRCGWQASTEVLLRWTSGALNMSTCLRQLAMVLDFCWMLATLTGFGLPSPTEIVLSVGCGQKRQIKINYGTFSSPIAYYRGQAQNIFHVRKRIPWVIQICIWRCITLMTRPLEIFKCGMKNIFTDNTLPHVAAAKQIRAGLP